MHYAACIALLMSLRVSELPCYAPDPVESRVWIEGRSTVNAFTCEAREMEGLGVLEAGQAVQGQLSIPVSAFDCGKPAMNRDLQAALKAERFPTIRFVLENVQVLKAAGEEAAQLAVAGRLTIAGQTRPVQFTVTGKLLSSGKARLAGSLPLRLSTFHIPPPTALLGLIRVHDQITVHFDLMVRPLPMSPCAVVVVDSTNQNQL